ncbi:DUF4446 family protein [Paenibacillus sp. J5C_2022]|uniref:DUF4446 family protein n=1 Tax=Paenibacillus sp. J5C2022 TaxID=2977129 RepID=UPI0021D2E102|nr:DUF4446 family protein [Paenibacillus sp. J5C2022]MCU6710993.1 DUF4446 family protein [Paenibacillus sp. J5C2022]
MGSETFEPLHIIVILMAGVTVVLAIGLIMLGRRLKKLRRQYVAVMGNTGVTNFESVIIELKSKLDDERVRIDEISKQLEEVRMTLPQLKSKTGVHRYNAFGEGGSDLSFSIAIVNDEKDGLVFSGLHSRENTYVYAKPVSKGDSSYPLTPEELKAIEEAK